MFLVLQTGFEPRVSLDAIDYSIDPMSCTLTFHVCRGTQCLLIPVLVSLSNSYRYKTHWAHAGSSLWGQFDRLSTSIAYRIQNTESNLPFDCIQFDKLHVKQHDIYIETYIIL